MAQKLSVQIALEGGKEVERQLADIGEAGQQAFKQIDQAAQQAGGFRNLKMADVTAQLKEMGVTGKEAIDQIKQAVRTAGKFEGLTAGVKEVENAFDRAAETAGRATVAFGLTRRELGALKTAARQIDLGPIGGQLVAFGRIGAAFGPVGIAISAIGAAIGTVTAALSGFAAEAAKTASAIKPLNALTGENASAMQIAFAQMGVSAETFGKDFAALAQKVQEASRSMADDVEQSAQRIEQAHLNEAQAATSLEQAELNLRKLQLARREQRTGREDPRARANLERAQKALEMDRAEQAVAQAALALRKAQHESLVAEANDLQTNIQLYEKLAQGGQAAFSPLVEQSTKTKALLGALAKAGKDWEFVLADILKNSTALERIQIGQALGLDPKVIATWAKGSEALRQARADAERLKLSLQDQANLDAMTASWNRLTATVSAAFQQMGASAAPFLTLILQGLQGAVERLIGTFQTDPIMSWVRVVAVALNPLTGLIQEATRALVQWGATLLGIDLNTFSNAAVSAWNAIITAIMSAISWVKAFANANGQTRWDMISSLGVAAWNLLIQVIMEAISWVQAFNRSLGEIGWDALVSAGVAAWNAIIAAIQRAINKIKEFQAPGAPLPEPGGTPMASGGLMGGRGTGTSDSNLAWLSRGEHVMPARAVAQPGVLAFLEALRRSGGNLRSVLDGMGRFALGGLVPRAIPAFATGGSVGSMSHVTIQFPGLPPVAGLRASSAVVEELQRSAALAQVRSGGRKPSRYS